MKNLTNLQKETLKQRFEECNIDETFSMEGAPTGFAASGIDYALRNFRPDVFVARGHKLLEFSGVCRHDQASKDAGLLTDTELLMVELKSLEKIPHYVVFTYDTSEWTLENYQGVNKPVRPHVYAVVIDMEKSEIYFKNSYPSWPGHLEDLQQSLLMEFGDNGSNFSINKIKTPVQKGLRSCPYHTVINAVKILAEIDGGLHKKMVLDPTLDRMIAWVERGIGVNAQPYEDALRSIYAGEHMKVMERQYSDEEVGIMGSGTAAIVAYIEDQKQQQGEVEDKIAADIAPDVQPVVEGGGGGNVGTSHVDRYHASKDNQPGLRK